MPERKKFDVLDPPPGALQSGGTEIFRAVIVDGELHVSIRNVFDDAGTWGILLMDIARHAARIYEREGEMTFAQALKRIDDLYAAERDRPTDMGETHDHKQHQ